MKFVFLMVFPFNDSRMYWECSDISAKISTVRLKTFSFVEFLVKIWVTPRLFEYRGKIIDGALWILQNKLRKNNWLRCETVVNSSAHSLIGNSYNLIVRLFDEGLPHFLVAAKALALIFWACCCILLFSFKKERSMKTL